MKKRIAVLLIALIALGGFGATRTWNSSGSTDMNDGANYNPTGAIDAGDDLVFDNTSVINATATAALTVGSVTTAANYSGNWSMGTYQLRTAGNQTFDHTGTLTIGDSMITSGASGNIHVGTGVSSVTGTTGKIRFNTSTAGVLDLDESGVTFQSLTIDGVVSHEGVGEPNFRQNSLAFLMTDSSTFTNNKRINFFTATGGTTHQIGIDCVINGNNVIYFFPTGNGVKRTLPAIAMTGTAVLGITNYIYDRDTVNYTGNISAYDIAITGGSGGAHLIHHFKNITAANNLTIGGGNATFTGNFGGATITAKKYIGQPVTGLTTTLNFDSSAWTLTDSLKLHTGQTINAGKATITFTGTTKTGLNPAGKKLPNIVINKTEGGGINLVDSLQALSLHLQDGVLNTGGNNIITSGFQRYAADSLYAGIDTFRITGDAAFSVDTTCATGWPWPATINTRDVQTNTDSVYLDLQGNDTVNIRSFSLWAGARMAYPGKTCVMTGNMEYPHSLNIQDGILTLDGTLIHSNRIFLRSFTKTNQFDIAGADITQSTGMIYLQPWNGLNDTFPKLNMPLGSAMITGHSVGSDITVAIVDSLILQYFATRNDEAKNLTLNFLGDGYKFYGAISGAAGIIAYGNDNSSILRCNFGSGKYDTKFIGGHSSEASNKGQIFDFGTSDWTVSGDVLIQPSTTVLNPTDFVIDSTSAIKSSDTRFADSLCINAPTYTVTTADNFTCGALNVAGGTLVASGDSLYVARFLRAATGATLTFDASSRLRLGPACVWYMGNKTWPKTYTTSKHSAYDGGTIASLYMGTDGGDSLVIEAGKKVTLTARGSLRGAGTTRNAFVSANPLSACTLSTTYGKDTLRNFYTRAVEYPDTVRCARGDTCLSGGSR